MPDTLTTALRQLVFERAKGCCEYCLLSQVAAAYKHEPDHIIPKQHDGQTIADNERIEERERLIEVKLYP